MTHLARPAFFYRVQICRASFLWQSFFSCVSVIPGYLALWFVAAIRPPRKPETLNQDRGLVFLELRESETTGTNDDDYDDDDDDDDRGKGDSNDHNSRKVGALELELGRRHSSLKTARGGLVSLSWFCSGFRVSKRTMEERHGAGEVACKNAWPPS